MRRRQLHVAAGRRSERRYYCGLSSGGRRGCRCCHLRDGGRRPSLNAGAHRPPPAAVVVAGAAAALPAVEDPSFTHRTLSYGALLSACEKKTKNKTGRRNRRWRTAGRLLDRGATGV